MHRPRRHGFTIMEILIATTILVVGLLGVLALFPAAIHTGKVAVEETTAAAIAKSVADAIRTGIRYRQHTFSSGRAQELYTFFIFEHDGVTATPPARPEDANPDADYFIVLPFIKGITWKNGDAAYNGGPVFVYPEDDEGVAGRAGDEGKGGRPYRRGGQWVWDDPARADDDSDDGDQDPNDPFDMDVRKVYSLGSNLPFAAEDDPMAQYSFAFSIRVADKDGNKNVNPQQHRPGNDLFEVRIMIFRSFQPGTTNAKPVYETSFLVAR
ncbi:MAG: prepilin-type N-terminal cleavage/methylation domain-containing protein [Planctomycetes bacterium]|nr:prepilin-type N-terminal cleavage/methylation domain-containing protein [Planctomycetota bacterium]